MHRVLAHLAVPALATILLAASSPQIARAQDSGARGGARAAPASFDAAWNAVSRTYWDTLFVRQRWQVAYDSIRLALVEGGAMDAEAERRAIRRLIAVPGQSHFALIPGAAVPVPRPPRASAADEPAVDAAPGTVGLALRSIDDTVVAWRVTPGGAADRAGVRPGDAIVAVDTVRLAALRAEVAGRSGADTTTVQRLITTYALAQLGGSVGESIRLTVRDARGAEREVALVRTPIEGRLTQMGNLPPIVVSATREPLPLGDGRTATLIGFSAWFPAIAPQLDEYLFGARGTPGLVVDLRGNPGGVIGMLAGVSGHMLDTTVALGTMHGRGATIRFVANPRTVDRGGARVGTITAPIALLVDEFTGSTSEFFSAGMQAIGRARIFGTVSAGQSLPALMSRLPNGDVLMHAIADHEDAAGRRVEGAGVRPDELVPLRRVDLRSGRDAALEAARAWLRTQHP
ncbi:MAG: hypothetical protein KJZ74_09090 [Gemmatimonadales bacterium]|nr:hypothetical protein [Gemmatimonadales bacterium]